MGDVLEGFFVPPNGRLCICHPLCMEQEKRLRVQNNGLTVPSSYPPCSPNLPTPGTGRDREQGDSYA